MDPVTGALVAAAVGWTSILVVVVAPLERIVAPERLRAVGAVTLGLVGLSILGVPLPETTPIGLMTVGLLGAALEPPLRHGIALPGVREASLPGCTVPEPKAPDVASPRHVTADAPKVTASVRTLLCAVLGTDPSKRAMGRTHGRFTPGKTCPKSC